MSAILQEWPSASVDHGKTAQATGQHHRCSTVLVRILRQVTEPGEVNKPWNHRILQYLCLEQANAAILPSRLSPRLVSAVNFAQNLVYFNSGGKFCPSTKWVELEALTLYALLPCRKPSKTMASLVTHQFHIGTVEPWLSGCVTILFICLNRITICHECN